MLQRELVFDFRLHRVTPSCLKMSFASSPLDIKDYIELNVKNTELSLPQLSSNGLNLIKLHS